MQTIVPSLVGLALVAYAPFTWPKCFLVINSYPLKSRVVCDIKV